MIIRKNDSKIRAAFNIKKFDTQFLSQYYPGMNSQFTAHSCIFKFIGTRKKHMALLDIDSPRSVTVRRNINVILKYPNKKSIRVVHFKISFRLSNEPVKSLGIIDVAFTTEVLIQKPNELLIRRICSENIPLNKRVAVMINSSFSNIPFIFLLFT